MNGQSANHVVQLSGLIKANIRNRAIHKQVAERHRYNQAVMAVIMGGCETIPERGFVVASRCTDERPYRYYYHVQVRLMLDYTYSVVWVHSSGHENVSEEGITTLEAALERQDKSLRSYWQTDAEETAYAAEVIAQQDRQWLM